MMTLISVAACELKHGQDALATTRTGQEKAV